MVLNYYFFLTYTLKTFFYSFSNELYTNENLKTAISVINKI